MVKPKCELNLFYSKLKIPLVENHHSHQTQIDHPQEILPVIEPEMNCTSPLPSSSNGLIILKNDGVRNSFIGLKIHFH